MRAAAYARFSSDNQREESIEAQLRAIRDYAAREGFNIIRVFTDEAKSATTDQRPGFLDMIASAEAEEFDVLIVHKLDRFSRDRFDSAMYKRRLAKAGVRLISVLENIDGSPESIILESVLEGMAEYYSKNLAREVMKGMKETALQCKHTGGIPPLGYDVASDKSYVINETEAEAVRLIFTAHDEGKGYGQIIDELNLRGLRTKRGQSFGKNSIYSILRNEKYAGVYVYNRTAGKVGDKRNNHKSKSDDEIIRIPGGVPAIVELDLFERVQQRMDKNKHKHNPGAYAARDLYILSGHILCGRCGRAMVGNRNKKKNGVYNYYVCTGRKQTRTCDMPPVPRDDVEALVIDALYENMFAPDVVSAVAERILEYVQTTRNEVPAQLATYRKQLAGVTFKINNIVESIANGMFHESMKEKMDQLETEKVKLGDQIAEAERKQAAGSFTREQVVGYLRLFEHVKEMDKHEQKKVIERFVDKVVVYDDHIDLDVITAIGQKRTSKPVNDKSAGTADEPAVTDAVKNELTEGKTPNESWVLVGGGGPHKDTAQLVFRCRFVISRG